MILRKYAEQSPKIIKVKSSSIQKVRNQRHVNADHKIHNHHQEIRWKYLFCDISIQRKL